MKTQSRSLPLRIQNAKEQSGNLNLSIGISILCFSFIYFLQLTRWHQLPNFPGSFVVYKAPYLIILTSVVLSATISKQLKVSRFLTRLSFALPLLTPFYIYKLDKSLLIYGHGDKTGMYKSPVYIAASITVFMFIIFFLGRSERLDKKRFTARQRSYQRVSKGVLFFFAIAASLYVSSYLIIDERHPYMENALNFMIVIHSILQAHFGKFVFFDQYSQYGGYSLILEPLFGIIGVSVFKITLLFAVLNMAFMLINYVLISKLIKSSFLIAVTFGAFIYFHYFAFVIWPAEKYFQVYPLRTIFPALSLAVIVFSHKRQSLLLGIITGLAVIWNIETGIAIFVASILWLLILNIKRLKSIMDTVIYLLATALAFLTPLLVSQLRSGLNFDFQMFMQGVTTYGATRQMSDLLLNKFWIVCVVAFIALVTLDRDLQTNDRPLNPTRDMRDTTGPLLVYIGLLGISLLSYHLLRQGQHEATLSNSGWLFPLSLAVLVDRLRLTPKVPHKVPAGRLWRRLNYSHLNFYLTKYMSTSLLAFAVIGLFMIQKGTVVANEERIWQFSKPSDRDLYNYVDDQGRSYYVTIAEQIGGTTSPYKKRAEIARMLKTQNLQDDMLILSTWDSLLYFEAGAKSPVQWANWWHAYTDDEFSQAQKLLETKAIKYVLVDSYYGVNQEPFLVHAEGRDQAIISLLEKNYVLEKEWDVGKMYTLDGWQNAKLLLYKVVS